MSLKIAVPEERLLELIETQIRNNFLLENGEPEAIRGVLSETLRRTEACFRPNRNKYYWKDGELFFNPYHGSQYCAFLYYLGNTLWKKSGPVLLCDKIYGLNKMLNGLDLLYDVQMPEHFINDHPVGTVLGRAQYGYGFAFAQNCTVGNNKDIYPVIGKNVSMKAGARLAGNCRVGDNVILSAGCYVKDQDVPDCSLVFGSSPNLIIKTRDESYFQRFKNA